MMKKFKQMIAGLNHGEGNLGRLKYHMINFARVFGAQKFYFTNSRSSRPWLMLIFL